MARSHGTARHRAVFGLTATIAVATLALSGCSSSGGKGTSSGPAAATPAGNETSSSGAGLAAAQAEVQKASVLPTKIPITVPLSKTPPTGKKVFFLSQSSGDYQRWTGGFVTAAKQLNWSPTVLTVAPGGSPADLNSLAQQAIQQGANYLAVAGPVFPTNNALVSAAKAAKVPLFYFSTSVAPQGEANWEFAAVGATSEYNYRGKLLADQAIMATNGKAKALFLNTPEFLVFQTLASGVKTEFNQSCSGCSLDSLNVPVTDVIAGKAGSAVVAYLRSHPDINLLICNQAVFCADVQSKAKGAGITVGKGGIPIVTGAQNDSLLSWLADGTAVSGQATPYEYIGWQLVDAMARYSVGDSIEPNWKATVPEYLYTAENSPSGTKPYQGPTDFESQFKALWKV